MPICIYAPLADDFSTNGLGILTPLECTVEEQAAGKYEIELVHPIDSTLRWMQIQNGCIVKVPAPVRESPLYEAPAIEESTPVTVTRRVWKATDGQHIRSKPDRLSKKMGSVRKGQEVVELEDAKDPWIKVCKVNGGQVGYMSTRYLKQSRTVEEVIEPAKPAPSTVVEINQSRDQLFRIYSVEQDSEAGTVTAKGMHVFYDDVGNLINAKYEVKNADAATVMSNVKAYLLQAAEVDFQPINLTGSITGDFSYKTPIEAYLDPDEGIVAQTNAMLIRDNWDAYLLPDMVRDMGVTIRRGKNLIGVEVTNDISDIVTRIIPIGKNKNGDALGLPGVRYIDSPHINEHPFPRIKCIEYDVQTGKDGFNSDTAVINELKRLVQEEFNNGADLPTYGMEVDFVLLGNTAEYANYASLQAVHLYDTVTVIDEMLGLKAKVRVTGYKWNCLTEQYESVTLGELQDVKQTVYSFNLPNKGVSGNKIMNNSLPGDAMRNASIEYAKIAVAAIEQLTANSLTALTARIQELVAGSVTTDELYAGIADITKATIETAEINWASIDELNAAVATLVQANIGTADIDFAHVKDLVTNTAIITEGVGGQLFISRLAVTEANIVSLTTGELVVKGEDGHFYSLSVDAGGNIVTTLKQLNNDDVQDLSINAGEKLVEGSVTAACLNAREIFADNAVIRQLIAANLDVDQLFAREAFINLLRTSKIVGDKSIQMIVGEAEDLNRRSGVEVIEGTFAQAERREGEGIRIFSKIEPKQDKTYGDPYPGGAGKNLLSLLGGENVSYSRVTPTVADNAINLQMTSGTSSGFQQWYAYFPIPETAKGKDVTFSINAFTKSFATGNTTVIAEQFNSNKAAISGASYIMFSNITSAPVSKSMLLNSSCAYIRIIFRADQGEAAPVGGSVWFGNIQLELGSTATSFAPYANTPAIEGWTGLNATHRGKNLYNKDFKSSDVIPMPSYDKIPIRCAPGTVCSWSLKGNAFAGSGAYALFTDQLDFNGSNYNGGLRQWIGLGSSGAANAEFGTFTVPASGLFYIGVLGSQGAKAAELMQNLMLVEGAYTAASMLDFEPFAGNVYHLQFGETVYGGKVDWHAGGMTVNRLNVVLDGTEKFQAMSDIYNGTGRTFLPLASLGIATPTNIKGDVVCSHYPTIVYDNINNSAGIIGIASYHANTHVAFRVQFTSIDAWKAYLAEQYANGTPVHFCYELAEPTTIQLTPTQITTLNGINTVYTNADGGRVEFGHDLVEVVDNVMPPASPKVGALWLDRSLTPAVLRRWSGTEWEIVNDVSLIESVQDALLTKQAELEAEQKRTALYLKLDDSMKAVRIGQNGVTSEFRIDAFGSGVVVNDEIFSRFEANRVVFGNMEIRKPNVGGLAFDSIN